MLIGEAGIATAAAMARVGGDIDAGAITELPASAARAASILADLLRRAGVAAGATVGAVASGVDAPDAGTAAATGAAASRQRVGAR